jgi:hypothetical protein
MANQSDLNITKTPSVTIAEGSIESAFLNSGAINRLNVGVSNSTAGGIFGGGGTYSVGLTNSDPNLTSEDIGNDVINSVKPQLADISVFSNTTYLDSKGVTRARLVLKVKNSSGKKLLGVDTKIINFKEGA